jgi:SAM-dependent methyltransferase
MSQIPQISEHYASGNLAQRLAEALSKDGIDPERATVRDLAPYDQFHGRGLEATEELVTTLEIDASHHVLDVGSGIGGPARYFANRFGCQVTGIDLTDEFCEVARLFTERAGLQEHVKFEQGNALNMPFSDSTFDGAYSMNVSMNIADKGALFREIHRVLRSGSWLALSEVAKGSNGDVRYPTPWAASASASFLVTPDETQYELEKVGFKVVSFRDATDDVVEFGRKSRALVEQGEKPRHRAVQLIHGDLAAEAMKNTATGVAEGRIIPIEVICRKEI